MKYFGGGVIFSCIYYAVMVKCLIFACFYFLARYFIL